MRRLALIALLMAPAPASAALRVGAPHNGRVLVRGAHRGTLLVATLAGRVLTNPRVAHGSRALLPVTRAGATQLEACAPGTLTVTAYRHLRATGRAHRALHPTCTAPKPAAISPDLPDGTTCDQLDPAVCLQPFPDDRFRVGGHIHFPDGAMPSNVGGVPVTTGQFVGNDGFSPGSALITRVPGIDTPKTLTASGAVPIDDIARYRDRRQPVVVIDAKTGKRWPVWTEIDTNPSTLSDRNVIIRPARDFREGHRYIVALRFHAAASPAFRALRDGVLTTDTSLEGRRKHFESLFRSLARAGVGRDSLFEAWDFTVATEDNLAGRMLHIRNDAFRQLGDTNLADLKVQGKPPAFTVDKIVDNPDPKILRQVQGTVAVPCYLDTLNCTSGGTFNNVDGLPAQMPGNMQQARYTCNIPNVAKQGAPLRAGIYGHGLLGSRDEVNQGQLKTFSQNHGLMFCATDWSGMACSDLPDDSAEGVEQLLADGAAGRLKLPDCDIPTVGTILADISNFPKLADRVQQGILNFLYLGRVMIHPDGFSKNPAFQIKGKSVIDTTRLYYDGNSQGGIIGGALISVAPDLNHGVLGVTGMNYSTLLRRSSDFDRYAQILYNAYPDELQRPVLLQLLQMLWDRAENDGYAQHMTTHPYADTPAHTVLMHIGFGDHQVSNYAAKVLARTVGAHAFAPWTDPGRDTDVNPFFGLPPVRGKLFRGSAIVMWDSGSPPPPKDEKPARSGEDPHEIPRKSPLGQQQKSDFLRPGGVITDVCGKSPCYAGGYKHSPNP